MGDDNTQASPEDPLDASQGTASHGIWAEFVDFLKSNPLWWVTPIVLMTVLLVGAAMLLPSPVAPFIYSLF